jgi:hypothetical protein
MEKARRILRESDESLKDGYGFENQREDCVRFENKRGLEILEEHRLIETSATWDREKFSKIITKAVQERKEIPVIVFPRVDRFARNLEAAGYYLGLLRQNGLKIGFAEEDLMVDNEASTMTVLMFFIHSFKADQDGKQIKHNLLGGRDKLATVAHQVPNGMVMWPFDYMPKRIYGKMVTGKPSINKERATWVMKWAEWILEEGAGLAEVCRLMNQNHPLVLTRRGRKWSPKAIRDILRSRQLVGEFCWKGKLYLEDENLRILGNEQFEALQKRLDENRERSYYNAAKYDYPPLPKMVFHACGQLMYGVPVNGKPYYRCPKCRRSYISAQIIWNELQEGIKDKLLKEERLIPAIRIQFNNKDTIAQLEQEIRTKTDEIKKWQNAKDSAFHMGMMLKNYPQDRVQEEIDKAEEKIQHLEVEKTNLGNRLSTLTERRLDEEGIRRLCQLLAKNIDHLTKNQWEVLNKLLKLKVKVYSKELVIVNVDLPPVRDTRDTQIEFSRL